jgi:hypothetical protein
MLGGRQHGKDAGTIAIRAANAPAQDALGVLPQHFEVLIALSTELKECFQCSTPSESWMLPSGANGQFQGLGQLNLDRVLKKLVAHWRLQHQ